MIHLMIRCNLGITVILLEIMSDSKNEFDADDHKEERERDPLPPPLDIQKWEKERERDDSKTG